MLYYSPNATHAHPNKRYLLCDTINCLQYYLAAVSLRLIIVIYQLLLNVDLIILIIVNAHAASALPEGADAYS